MFLPQPGSRTWVTFPFVLLDPSLLAVTFWGLPEPHTLLLLPGFRTLRIWFGTSSVPRLGISLRIPREWSPWQQQPHGRFQNFYLLLMVQQKFRKHTA